MKEIHHRQPSGYYLCLLGRDAPSIRPALMNENSLLDVCDDRPAKRIRTTMRSICSGGVREGMLALENGDESGHDDDGDGVDVTGDDIALKASVDKALSHLWGPFKFSNVVRILKSGPNKGRELRQWQVVCCFHADPGDGDTKCTRTMSYHGNQEREDVAKRLRCWCVSGRKCKTRAIKNKKPHKGLPLKRAAEISDTLLTAQLEEGMAAESWIIANGVASDDDSSMSSISSDSDSSSSS